MRGMQETERALKVRVYRNADPTFFGKDVVVNRRQTRSLPALLNALPPLLGMQAEQVHALVTPRGGTEVSHLGDLEDRREYVAVSPRRRFKDIGYVVSLEAGSMK